MRTITIELPDDTPIISMMKFAAQIQCDMKLVEHNHFRFSRNDNQGSVVRMPTRARVVSSSNGPGAA
ncbi:hypothetical protein [Cycloclasticus pugetii]|uniref:hypothetical protein n=1 Tax=Cycloclasticus pugetii TaxID=34068 RepID=UPI003A94AF66